MKKIEQCQKCGKYIQVNKFIFGSLHFCVDPSTCEKCGGTNIQRQYPGVRSCTCGRSN